MKESIKEIVKDLQSDTNFFQLFDEEGLEHIAPYFERASFAADATIFSEGDPGDFIAFVKKGRVEVKKQTEFKGKQIIIAQMSKGSVIGELALFDEKPRSATIEALEDTDLLILSREALDSFIEDYPLYGIKILKGISRVLSMRLRQLADRLVVIF